MLRGFALLGILTVNFWGRPGTFMPSVDTLAGDLLGAFADSSFYPLYSFLFGIGFAVQLDRARRRGGNAAHLYLRRMLALFLIGTVHAVFIWEGDILVTYALLGLLLIPLHRLPQKGVLALVIVLAALNLNGPRVQARVDAARHAGEDASAQLTSAAVDEEARITLDHRMLASGAGASYVPVTIGRWKWYAQQIRGWTNPLTFLLRDVLVFFLIGLMVGRARILHEPAAHRRTLAITALIGFLCFVGGNAITRVMPLAGGFFAGVIVAAGNLGPTALYIAGIALLFSSVPRARQILSVFAAPGRMGLTNYLMQSTTMTLLLMPYGLGWQLSTTVWLALNIAFFFGVQAPFSRWWLARFQYGPAEWLWRSMTYGERQPLRIRHAAADTPVTVAASA